MFANIIEFWGAPDRLLFRAKNVNNLKISIFFYHPSTLFSAPTRTKNTLFGFHREDECSSWKYAFNKRKQKRANRYKSKRLNIYNTNMNATNGVHIFVIVLFIYTRQKKKIEGMPKMPPSFSRYAGKAFLFFVWLHFHVYGIVYCFSLFFFRIKKFLHIFFTFFYFLFWFYYILLSLWINGTFEARGSI